MPSSELIIVNTVSGGVIVSAFAYCVYLNLTVLPRKISSSWYLIGFGALAFCFSATVTLLILFCFLEEALSWRRTHVAQLIGDVIIWLVYAGLLGLGLSIFALTSGLVVGILKRRGPSLGQDKRQRSSRG